MDPKNMVHASCNVLPLHMVSQVANINIYYYIRGKPFRKTSIKVGMDLKNCPSVIYQYMVYVQCKDLYFLLRPRC